MGKVRVSPKRKTDRKAVMATLRHWLVREKKTQVWAAKELRLHAGYMNKLLRGKQVASGEIVEKARRLMSPPSGPVVVGPALATSSNESTVVQKQTTKKRIVGKKVPPRRALPHPVTPVRAAGRQLSIEEIEALKKITLSYLSNFPGVSEEELVRVVQGVKSGLLGRP